MASKKDMRRPDLVIPYLEPKATNEVESDIASTMSSTLPMIAIVSRNKLLGWTAVIFALQSWLSETPAKKAKAATPGYFSVLLALSALFVSYSSLFLPPTPQRGGTATEAPAAAPPA